jgi:hypothetical protein
MEPLMWIAIIVFILSFFLIVRFSQDQVKYHNSKGASVKSSVWDWKVLGIRTRYYQLVVATSGLITMAIVAIIKVFI